MIKYFGLGCVVFFVSAYFLKQYQSSPVTEEKEFHVNSFVLSEVSDKVGLIHSHKKEGIHPSLKNVEPWLTSVGSGVAISDVNNDGFQDIFLCNTHRAQSNFFYQNNGDGTFSERAHELGLGDINRPYPCVRPMFFDVDQDGRQDFFMGTTYCPKLFLQSKEGRFVDVTEKSGIGKGCVYSMASTFIDFDDDGKQDLIVAGYFPAVDLFSPNTTKVMQENITGAKNGGPSFFYRNNGNGTFTDITSQINIELKGWVIAIGVYDLNYDGKPDLWFAVDFNKNKVFLNVGKAKFRDVSSSMSNELSRSGMSVDIEDVEADQKPLAYVSQIYEPSNNVKGNQLWKFFGAEKISDLADAQNVIRCGWSWGTKFIDFDNDSYEDLVVANGFISANPKKAYWYNLMQINATRKNVISDAKNWADMSDFSLAGYQKDCLYYNDRGHFRNIASQTAFNDFELDGRSVSRIDFLNNGSLGLVISNQSQKTLFFENKQTNKNQWIGFNLLSQKGMSPVYGAQVQIELAGKKRVKQSFYLNGFSSQNDPRIHFGLGSAKKVDKIVVKWPNGISEEIGNLELNKYHDLRQGSID